MKDWSRVRVGIGFCREPTDSSTHQSRTRTLWGQRHLVVIPALRWGQEDEKKV